MPKMEDSSSRSSSRSRSSSSRLAQQISAARDRGYLDGRRDGYHKGHEDGRQEGYQLALADIISNAQRLRAHPSISTAETPDSDNGRRSDRSSSLEDVIPPSIHRTHRPALAPVLPVYDAPPPPSPLILAEAPPLAARRAPKPRVPNRGRGRVSARHDPAWQAAMAASGTKIGITMGRYIDGDITVNGEHAITMPRAPPCARCRAAGRECKVLDMTREKNLVSGICSHCIRHRRKCTS